MNPILKWPGGKHYLRKDILPLIPTHEIYLEAFAGGLSILLNKLMAGTEIANDLDSDVINLYQQLTKNYDQFHRALGQYNCNKDDFDRCSDYRNLPLNVERATQFFVRNRMARGESFQWSSRTRRNMPEMVSRWLGV